MYVRESRTPSSVFRAVMCNVVLGFWFEVIVMSNLCSCVSIFIDGDNTPCTPNLYQTFRQLIYSITFCINSYKVICVII